MFPKVPINREKCICEILRKNVKDALIFWKRLYIKGFLRVGNFSPIIFGALQKISRSDTLCPHLPISLHPET